MVDVRVVDEFLGHYGSVSSADHRDDVRVNMLGDFDAAHSRVIVSAHDGNGQHIRVTFGYLPRSVPNPAWRANRS